MWQDRITWLNSDEIGNDKEEKSKELKMGGLKYRVWSSTKHGNGGSHEEAASYKAQPKGQNFVPFT